MMKSRTIIAAIAASVISLAMFTGTAMADQPTPTANDSAPTSTITVKGANGNLDTTLTAYRLGTYTDIVLNQDQSAVTSVNVADVDDATGNWIKAALATAGVTENTALSHVANIANTKDAAKLRAIASALAKADTKPTPIIDKQKATGVPNVTLDVKTDGLYLVTADGSMPMIVSTLIGGKKLGTSDGTVTLKSTSITVDKKINGKDSDSGIVGHTYPFTATFVIPADSTNPTKLVYTDTPNGMTIDQQSVTVTIDGTKVTDVTPQFDENTHVMTVDVSAKITGNYGKTVVIAYNATLDRENPSNTGSLSATLDGDNVTSPGDTVDVHTYGFQLKKIKASDKSTLAGAGFKLQAPNGKWQKYDAASGKWTDANDEASATQVTTGADGTFTFKGLSTGTYFVKETLVPDGMIQSVAPTVKIVIADDGSVSVSTEQGAESDPNLTDVANGVLTVTNIDSITQLPLTGGFQTFTMVFAGMLVIMGASVLGVTTVRRMKTNH